MAWIVTGVTLAGLAAVGLFVARQAQRSFFD